jgi:hypothetical protein
MATKVQFYTEGGMPSNRQVCGVRNVRVFNNANALLVAADVYKLFDLDTNEIVLGYGIDVLSLATSASAVTVTISDGGGALTALTAVPLKTLGKKAGVISQLDGAGIGVADTLSAVITGEVAGVDFNLYAIVANVDTPETFTQVDTPAP